ncbi:hypothetical protein FB45DRAFT_1052367 [Roridomyces roridus]|uniref:Uncharacterized protein n=1 Tax=Roridomyces roridus TaxID=1738132 RepID=A0AAD7CGE3_9AGAR|nr:hypothetical protein FB45DRAFT_1052367 [Roridomyces roridus]
MPELVVSPFSAASFSKQPPMLQVSDVLPVRSPRRLPCVGVRPSYPSPRLVLIHGIKKLHPLLSLLPPRLLTFSCTLATTTSTLGPGHFGFSTLNRVLSQRADPVLHRHPVNRACSVGQRMSTTPSLTSDPTYPVSSRIAPMVQYRVIILRIDWPVFYPRLHPHLLRDHLGLVPHQETDDSGLDLGRLLHLLPQPFFYGSLATTDPAFLRALRPELPAPRSPTRPPQVVHQSSSLFQPQPQPNHNHKTKRFSCRPRKPSYTSTLVLRSCLLASHRGREDGDGCFRGGDEAAKTVGQSSWRWRTGVMSG